MSDDSKLKTFNEILYENEKKWADSVYLRQPVHGVWHTYTWRETMLRARKIASFLKSIGLQKGDRVSILSKNCAEWFITDFGIALGGFVSVPLYATQHKDTIRYILSHAEVKVIFVGKLDHWEDQQEGIDDTITRIAFPYENSMPARYQWDDIIEKTSPQLENYIPHLDDIYTIIYTSGTTGHPKGAVITFRSMAHAGLVYEAEPYFSKDTDNRLFSYLPLGHIFERIAVEYTSINVKSIISFPESLTTFVDNLRDASPTVFISVPRLWSQFQKNILAKLPQKKLDFLLKIPLISFLVKRKIRHALGLKHAKITGSGSAPLSPHLIHWYKKLDIEILEGYGRTEDLAIATCSIPGKNKIGSVGRPRHGVEIIIDDNGEILTRSKTMMREYYRDKEATQKAFTNDGFLRTGDKGRIDDEGNIIIEGRISDTFKTDKGEFINPIPIESQFMKNSNIEQLCLIGLSLPQPVLIIVLSEEAKKLDMVKLTESLTTTLNTVNADLFRNEKVSHIIVAKEAWSPENNLLTPSLKIKRHAIHQKYISIATKSMDSDSVIIFE